MTSGDSSVPTVDALWLAQCYGTSKCSVIVVGLAHERSHLGASSGAPSLAVIWANSSAQSARAGAALEKDTHASMHTNGGLCSDGAAVSLKGLGIANDRLVQLLRALHGGEASVEAHMDALALSGLMALPCRVATAAAGKPYSAAASRPLLARLLLPGCFGSAAAVPAEPALLLVLPPFATATASVETAQQARAAACSAPPAADSAAGAAATATACQPFTSSIFPSESSAALRFLSVSQAPSAATGPAGSNGTDPFANRLRQHVPLSLPQQPLLLATNSTNAGAAAAASATSMAGPQQPLVLCTVSVVTGITSAAGGRADGGGYFGGSGGGNGGSGGGGGSAATLLAGLALSCLHQLPVMLTVLSAEDGRVLLQSAASEDYYGRRAERGRRAGEEGQQQQHHQPVAGSAAAAAAAAATGSDALDAAPAAERGSACGGDLGATRGPRVSAGGASDEHIGLLGDLFSLDPGKLQSVLEFLVSVAAAEGDSDGDEAADSECAQPHRGLVWEGIVRVPATQDTDARDGSVSFCSCSDAAAGALCTHCPAVAEAAALRSQSQQQQNMTQSPAVHAGDLGPFGGVAEGPRQRQQQQARGGGPAGGRKGGGTGRDPSRCADEGDALSLFTALQEESQGLPPPTIAHQPSSGQLALSGRLLAPLSRRGTGTGYSSGSILAPKGPSSLLPAPTVMQQQQQQQVVAGGAPPPCGGGMGGSDSSSTRRAATEAVATSSGVTAGAAAMTIITDSAAARTASRSSSAQQQLPLWRTVSAAASKLLSRTKSKMLRQAPGDRFKATSAGRESSLSFSASLTGASVGSLQQTLQQHANAGNSGGGVFDHPRAFAAEPGMPQPRALSYSLPQMPSFGRARGQLRQAAAPAAAGESSAVSATNAAAAAAGVTGTPQRAEPWSAPSSDSNVQGAQPAAQAAASGGAPWVPAGGGKLSRMLLMTSPHHHQLDRTRGGASASAAVHEGTSVPDTLLAAAEVAAADQALICSMRSVGSPAMGWVGGMGSFSRAGGRPRAARSQRSLALQGAGVSPLDPLATSTWMVAYESLGNNSDSTADGWASGRAGGGRGSTALLLETAQEREEEQEEEEREAAASESLGAAVADASAAAGIVTCQQPAECSNCKQQLCQGPAVEIVSDPAVSAASAATPADGARRPLAPADGSHAACFVEGAAAPATAAAEMITSPPPVHRQTMGGASSTFDVLVCADSGQHATAEMVEAAAMAGSSPENSRKSRLPYGQQEKNGLSNSGAAGGEYQMLLRHQQQLRHTYQGYQQPRPQQHEQSSAAAVAATMDNLPTPSPLSPVAAALRSRVHSQRRRSTLLTEISNRSIMQAAGVTAARSATTVDVASMDSERPSSAASGARTRRVATAFEAMFAAASSSTVEGVAAEVYSAGGFASVAGTARRGDPLRSPLVTGKGLSPAASYALASAANSVTSLSRSGTGAGGGGLRVLQFASSLRNLPAAGAASARAAVVDPFSASPRTSGVLRGASSMRRMSITSFHCEGAAPALTSGNTDSSPSPSQVARAYATHMGRAPREPPRRSFSATAAGRAAAGYGSFSRRSRAAADGEAAAGDAGSAEAARGRFWAHQEHGSYKSSFTRGGVLPAIADSGSLPAGAAGGDGEAAAEGHPPAPAAAGAGGPGGLLAGNFDFDDEDVVVMIPSTDHNAVAAVASVGGSSAAARQPARVPPLQQQQQGDPNSRLAVALSSSFFAPSSSHLSASMAAASTNTAAAEAALPTTLSRGRSVAAANISAAGLIAAAEGSHSGSLPGHDDGKAAAGSQHSNRHGSPRGQASTAGKRAWHEVRVAHVTDGATGQRLLVVMQKDVTAKVEAERHIMKVSEAEHRLLEQIFPRHVLTYMTQDGCAPLPTASASQLRHMDTILMAQPTGQNAAGDGSEDSEDEDPIDERVPGASAWRPHVRDCNALATWHEEVTILFADIQGFTPMCKELPATVVMRFLNDLFVQFDSLVDVYGVYKVETIGDCYVVAGGLISKDMDGMAAVHEGGQVDARHADRVVQFAKAMLRAAASMRMPTHGGPVRIRVGVHSGPVVSGVVGTRMPRFCLFGDTMNTASRMESTGTPGCIHVSQDTFARLSGSKERWRPSGGIEVKGKGHMETHVWAPAGAR